jgi:hypothetical protein
MRKRGRTANDILVCRRERRGERVKAESKKEELLFLKKEVLPFFA